MPYYTNPLEISIGPIARLFSISWRDNMTSPPKAHSPKPQNPFQTAKWVLVCMRLHNMGDFLIFEETVEIS